MLVARLRLLLARQGLASRMGWTARQEAKMWNNSWKGEVFHNNTEFWSIAVSAADRVELEASADEHSRGQLHMWPRVFVYDLVPPFSDFNLSNASLHDIIGRPAGCSGHQHAMTCSSFVWDTNQYGAANMLAWRVHHSPKYRVFSPEDVSHRGICHPRPVPTFVRPYARFTPSRVTA